MNDIEVAHLKRTLQNLTNAFEKYQEGQELMTRAILQCGERIDALEKAAKEKKFKPKIMRIER